MSCWTRICQTAQNTITEQEYRGSYRKNGKYKETVAGTMAPWPRLLQYAWPCLGQPQAASITPIHSVKGAQREISKLA